ncbi:hypothetical protein ACWDSJ_24910 [Nocardia sp. NPDC003482]
MQFVSVSGEVNTVADALDYFENIRRSIAERVVQVPAQQQMTQIRDAVETQVKDPTERENLLSKIAELESKYAQVVDQFHSYTDAHEAKIFDIQVAERRFKLRTSLLEREPAAVIIGGILLTLMTLALIGGMYSHTSTPDVLSNAYLLILGFFFGQTVGVRKKDAALLGEQ